MCVVHPQVLDIHVRWPARVQVWEGDITKFDRYPPDWPTNPTYVRGTVDTPVQVCNSRHIVRCHRSHTSKSVDNLCNLSLFFA
jgi:hypothetical protein